MSADACVFRPAHAHGRYVIIFVLFRVVCSFGFRNFSGIKRREVKFNNNYKRFLAFTMAFFLLRTSNLLCNTVRWISPLPRVVPSLVRFFRQPRSVIRVSFGLVDSLLRRNKVWFCMRYDLFLNGFFFRLYWFSPSCLFDCRSTS